jgi:hypothetical protein
MRLQLKIDPSTAFQLPAAAFLVATKDDAQGLPNEGLRHPLGIYNVSAANAISATLNVIAELDIVFQMEGKTASEYVVKEDRLRQLTKTLLLANGDHIDACEKVLKCYAQNDNGKVFRKIKDNFRSSLSPYEKHVMVQANHLKHRHSQIRSICLYTDSLVVPGYFVESSINSETVGPDPLIHGSSNTAFSYSRQLRLSVCGLLFVSRSLTALLSELSPKAPRGALAHDVNLMAMIERVAQLPEAMLPDEYAQEYPLVRKGAERIYVNYGGARKPKMLYNVIQVSTGFSGDGVTRSFQLPYLKV